MTSWRSRLGRLRTPRSRALTRCAGNLCQAGNSTRRETDVSGHTFPRVRDTLRAVAEPRRNRGVENFSQPRRDDAVGLEATAAAGPPPPRSLLGKDVHA